MILTLDIGGTKTMWALWEKLEMREKGREVTKDIADFGAFIEETIRGRRIDAISFAMAGPVKDRRLELTNTGQIIDLQQIRDRFSHIRRMAFLNDLEALAHSVPYLQGEQIRMFRHGNGEATGAKAIVSLGTGLGVAAMTREGVVVPSEGGHVDFAPRNQRQHQLLSRLEKKYDGHVSYERLLSGHGLSNLYREEEITPAEISKRAADGEPAALEAFEIYTEVLGAVCGNLAMTFLSSGGVYLGGGMTPKIMPFIDVGIFEKAFTDKGRFNEYLERLPVYAIMDEDAPSLGAACAVSAQADPQG